MTSPARRIQWTSGVTEVAEDLAGRRRGIGTVNHVAHGKNLSIKEVVDWVPHQAAALGEGPAHRGGDLGADPPGVERDGATLVELARADAAAQGAGREAEPELPAGAARHLAAPVTSAPGPIAYLREDGGAE